MLVFGDVDDPRFIKGSVVIVGYLKIVFNSLVADINHCKDKFFGLGIPKTVELLRNSLRKL